MALLYDPGEFMPRTERDFRTFSWVMAWPLGPVHVHDIRPGGTVLLVDSTRQRIVWHTRVTQCHAVPYEASASLALETERRWGLLPDVTHLGDGGFAIGWRAEAVARLDLSASDIEEVEGLTDDLALTGYQFLDEVGPFFRRHWGLDAVDGLDADDGWCSWCWRSAGWSTPVPR